MRVLGAMLHPRAFILLLSASVQRQGPKQQQNAKRALCLRSLSSPTMHTRSHHRPWCASPAFPAPMRTRQAQAQFVELDRGTRGACRRSCSHPCMNRKPVQLARATRLQRLDFSKDIMAAMKDLKAAGALPKWGSLLEEGTAPERRNTFIGELRQVRAGGCTRVCVGARVWRYRYESGGRKGANPACMTQAGQVRSHVTSRCMCGLRHA